MLLAASAGWSQRAPVGHWVNHVSGEPAWNENDPGAFYVASAHELAWGEAPLFVGHPGAPLAVLLRGVQEGLFLALAEPAEGFTRFTARHLARVHVTSKVLMTVLHLLSFLALHRLALRLTGDRRAAALATLGYATSFPVLYDLSRVSVEPLMVLFFAGSFLALWRAADAAREGRVGAAAAHAAVAGVAAVSGAMSKLSFLGPLPFFLVLYWLVLRGMEGRVRAIGGASLVGASLVALALWSQIVDWSEFVSEWRIYAGMPAAGSLTLADFLPGTGPRRILLLAELGFGAFAVGSFVVFVRRGGLGEPMLGFLAYTLYAFAFFGYRVVLEGDFLPFHYFFLPLAALCVFFGWGSVAAARRLGLPVAGAPGLAVALVWIALLHGFGAFAVAASREHDARQFAARRPAFEQLAALAPGGRIGVLYEGPHRGLHEELLTLHAIELPTPWGVRQSVLRRAVTGLFVVVPPRRAPRDAPRVFVPALGAAVVRLDGG
ncbi:MAG: hypothetical protein ACQGVC_22335 [Myxococcota bacterium]